jgi:hypothetical protein
MMRVSVDDKSACGRLECVWTIRVRVDDKSAFTDDDKPTRPTLLP